MILRKSKDGRFAAMNDSKDYGILIFGEDEEKVKSEYKMAKGVMEAISFVIKNKQ